MIRKMVCDVLHLMGHHASAAGGAEGVQLFERDRHDLMITDLQMPGLSGWDVIERPHQADPTVPVIILTGFATGERGRRSPKIASFHGHYAVTSLTNESNDA